MWVYNESAGVFSYHGRWNQLWINVTKPATPICPQQHISAPSLSPEIEPRIAEAYLAIRRAESAGGDISGMVGLLNSAIERAVQGNLSGAESLLDEVLILEPKVTEAGVEAGRLRLYLTAAGLAAASVVCVSLYLYLRSNMWLLWARAHWRWMVSWSGGNQEKLSDLERKIRDAAKPNAGGGLAVGELISGSKAISPDARAAAKELYRMVRKGVVKIFDPSPPGTFLRYLLSMYNATASRGLHRSLGS